MTPLDQLTALYASHSPERLIEHDIWHHLASGFVFSTPYVFAMGRPVCRYSKLESIADISHSYPRVMQNCWFVFAWIGPAQDVLKYLPYDLKWICWARRGKPIRFYELDTVVKKWQGVLARCENNPMFTTSSEIA